jgi:hypothetical protein
MTEGIDPFDVIDPATLAEIESAKQFAKSLIDEKCVRCVDFSKALAHTNCICEPMMELITAHLTYKGEQECIVAAWMTLQKVSREGK